jgi:2-oxoisovalerate dehydrogenase E1 component
MIQNANLLELMEHVSSRSQENITSYAADKRGKSILQRALLIRAVESVLLELFARGKIHGTIHTCVGQELTGAIVGNKIREGDFIASNHRGHGHFLGVTGNWRGLIDEIAGNRGGVCAGIGGSQHLFSSNFISNGPQGSLLPVAAGIALDRKHHAKENVVVSFIGEGTLGEGVVYETLNIDSLWELPHMVVCENNFYSQSTPQHIAVAGSIALRAHAFDIEVREVSTWNPAELDTAVDECLELVRSRQRPIFLLIQTYRLSAHSKGDDDRNADEVEWFRERDPLTILLKKQKGYRMYYDDILAEVRVYADKAFSKPKLSKPDYLVDQLPNKGNHAWNKYTASTLHKLRFGAQLNRFYADYLQRNERAYFLGEDIGDPYGGTFKISKGLQSAFPDRVITTPISEAAIVGIGAGLALTGNRPLVEIMFGDFITLAFDQIVNNASKFFHMYHGGVSCPMVVRTPLGGHRGYGPTHSQSLERFLVGIDNCVTLSLNSLTDADTQLSGLAQLRCPALVLENKSDYTLRTFSPPESYVLETGDADFPTILLRPEYSSSTITIVTYGGMARVLADNLVLIFEETDCIPELVVPSMIHPVDVEPIIQSIHRTRKLAERSGATCSVVRIAAPCLPIPSERELEESLLPNITQICSTIRAFAEI